MKSEVTRHVVSDASFSKRLSFHDLLQPYFNAMSVPVLASQGSDVGQLGPSNSGGLINSILCQSLQLGGGFKYLWKMIQFD